MAHYLPHDGDTIDVLSEDVAERGVVGADHYESVRRRYEDYFQTTHDELGLASTEQTRELRQWIEGIDPHDEGEIRKAERWYQLDYRKRLIASLELDQEIRHLLREDLVREGIISRDSFEEWQAWLHDRSRDYKEKETAVKTVLREYLRDREQLKRDRDVLLRDPRIRQVGDAKLQAEIRFLQDDREFYETMDFTQRRNLVDRVAAGLGVLEGGKEYRELYREAEKILLEATKAPQPALHRDKVGTWLKRIFVEGPRKGASPEDLRHFIRDRGDGTLERLIRDWRVIAVRFWTLRADPAFQGIRMNFVNTKAFLARHYDDRVAYVQRMREQRQEALALRSQARSALQIFSGALDGRGASRWLCQYLFSGRSTLAQLQEAVRTELLPRLGRKLAKVNHFKDVLAQARERKVELPVPSLTAFLALHYDAQVALVQGMERRLGSQVHRPHLLHMRHLLDLGDWDDAAAAIVAVRASGPLPEEVVRELSSAETYLRQYRGKDHEKAKKGRESKSDELQELRRLIGGANSAFQPIYLDLLREEESLEYIHALRWIWYNRVWCRRNHYLNDEKEYASLGRGRRETKRRLDYHHRRRARKVESDAIEGETGEKPYIQSSNFAPTNVHIDFSDPFAVTALKLWLREHRGDYRTLYWTNLIPHCGSSIYSESVHLQELARLTAIRSCLRSLRRKGVRSIFHLFSNDVPPVTSATAAERIRPKYSAAFSRN